VVGIDEVVVVVVVLELDTMFSICESIYCILQQHKDYCDVIYLLGFTHQLACYEFVVVNVSLIYISRSQSHRVSSSIWEYDHIVCRLDYRLLCSLDLR